MRLSVLVLLASVLVSLPLWSCGDEGTAEDRPSDRLSNDEPTPASEPLTLDENNLGVPIGFGDMETAAQVSSGFEFATSFNTAVVTVQVIDEREALTLDPTAVQTNPAPVQPERRLEALLDEVDSGLAAGGGSDYDNYVLVFDLFRVNGSWLVRWDGVGVANRDGEGSYGFWRDDMREDLKATIVDGVSEAIDSRNVTHVVVGTGMERLLLLNPEDFANFIGWFAEVRQEIKDRWDNVAVSSGMNWDRVVSDVVPIFDELSDDGESLRFSAMRRAWEQVATPFYAEADFIALSSEPTPEDFNGSADNLPNWQYALLAEVQGDKPIAWYSINWPVSSDAQKSAQRDYLRRFLVLNGGNDINLVAWRGLIDLVPNACDGFVNNLGMARTNCYAGMLSTSVAPTSLSDEFLPGLGLE